MAEPTSTSNVVTDPHTLLGVHDNPTLTLAKLYARSDLERALKEIFEEDVRVELVTFNEEQDSLSTLITGFSEERAEVSQDETDHQEESAVLDETRDDEPTL